MTLQVDPRLQSFSRPKGIGCNEQFTLSRSLGHHLVRAKMSQAYRDANLSGESRAHLGNVYNSTNHHSTYYGHAQSQSNEKERHDSHQELIIGAARDGQSRRLSILLSQGSEVDYKDRHGMTALHHAALCGFEDCVEELMMRGWNVNHYSDKFGDPLHLARAFGRRTVIEVFKRNRGRVCERPGILATPAAMLEELNDSYLQQQFRPSALPEAEPAAKLSVPPVHTSEVTQPVPSGKPPNIPAAVTPSAPQEAEQSFVKDDQPPLTEPPLEVERTAPTPAPTPAHESVRSSESAVHASPAFDTAPLSESIPPTPGSDHIAGLGVESLDSKLEALSLSDSIDHPPPSVAFSDSTEGDDRRYSTSTGMTSVSSSSKPGKHTNHSPRLASSIKMNLRDSEGSALRAAAADGKVHMVRALLEKGAPIDNSGVWDGFTALADAALHGQSEIVELLLNEGANPAFKCISSTSKFGSKDNTPLSLAAGKGHLGCMNLLFAHHQYSTTQLDEAYRAAKYRNRRDAMKLIQERGGGLV